MGSGSAFRELYCSHIGGYNQQHVPDGVGRWLEELTSCDTLSADGAPNVAELIGCNTYIEVRRKGC